MAWESPWYSLIMAGTAYIALSLIHQFPPSISPYPYYNYLADAFLHGQLHLRLIPEMVQDLVRFNGQYYLYWAPFPAVVLMPFVATFGVDFNDMLFTAVVGGVNVGLVAQIIRRADIILGLGLTRSQRALLVLFFALGTVHVTLVGRGRVWETGQLVGFACVALAYLSTLSLRGAPAFFLTGLALAGAAMTRNHLLFAGIWLAWYLISSHKDSSRLQLARYCLLGLTPVLLGVLSLASYNWLRFGNPLNVGLDHHLMAQVFHGEYGQYGAFDLHYLPTNLYYQLLHFPLLGDPLMGGSLFLMSPVWLAAFWAVADRARRRSALLLALSVVAVDVPILLLMGTGWKQFGSRYTLDFTVPLLLLAAQGVGFWPTRLQRWLTIISVSFFIAGAIALARVLR